MDEKPLLERIYNELVYKGAVKTQTEFAEKIGKTKGYVSSLMSSVSPIPKKIKQSLIDSFGINKLFLDSNGLTGSMFQEIRVPGPLPFKNEAFELGSVEVNEESVEYTKNGNEFIDIGGGRYIMLVPLVHEYAYGGYLVGYKDAEYIEGLPKHPVIVENKHKGKYLAFVMRNDSMDNGLEEAIRAGDIVVGRIIDKVFWKSKLHTHKFKEFIIVHKEGILVKKIKEQKVDEGILILESYNPDKNEFPDITVFLKDVNQIFNVTQVTKNR